MIGVSILRTILKFGFCIFRRVKVTGLENVPKTGAVLVAANHMGMADMFMIGYKIPRLIHWMAKEELFKFKPIAKFITYLGAYPLKRKARDTSAARTTFELLEKGEMVGIFPQGTRAKKGQPLPKAKAGVVKYAVETDTAVLPVAIWGKNRIFGKMYVKFGSPFKFPKPLDGTHYDKKQYLDMSQKLLDDIYAMEE